LMAKDEHLKDSSDREGENPFFFLLILSLFL
jgi:hypothetical protein